MAKTWIHAPTWLADPRVNPSMCKIGFYLTCKSFFDNNSQSYNPIKYEPTNWSVDLNMSKTTVINSIKSLEYLEFVVRGNNDLYIVHTPGSIPSSIIEPSPIIELKDVNRVQKMNSVSPKIVSRSPIIEPRESKNCTQDSLYERLIQGFETPIVFLKYINSNIIVDADCFIKILENMHRIEVFKLMRKQKINKDLTGFENNDKFQQCKGWVRELYEKHDDPSEDIPIDRYLLYLLVDCIENGNSAPGRFISAVQKLKSDGTRFEIDMSFHNKEKAKVDASEEMASRIAQTQKMLANQDRAIARAEDDEAKREEYIAKFPPEIVEEALAVARSVAAKQMAGMLTTNYDPATGEDFHGKRNKVIDMIAERKVTFYLKEYENSEKQLTTG